MVEVIKPWAKIEDSRLKNLQDGLEMLKNLEKAGRTCYKSEDKITDDSAGAFVKKIIKMGHESVLEHEKVTVRIVCDRGVSHEMVRHRICSFSQESTRYCDYVKKGDIQVIAPCFWQPIGVDIKNWQSDVLYTIWLDSMKRAEKSYNRLRELGASPQEARSVLPNSLKTEIVVTANLREWRLVFRQRTARAAHPQMREIMIPLLKEFKTLIPVVFDDLVVG